MDHSRRSLLFATVVLGIGLSGFFDGILLHQVLQWHHLLSLVPGEAMRDIGTQILADGLFHVLMYLVTVAGLWMLFRRRAALSDAVGWRTVSGGALLGFGLWNVIDVGFFHWILGIHRIRVNVPDPMLYDIGWLVALGLLPLAAAWLLLKRQGSGGGGGRPAAATLAVLVLIAAPLAARPQPNAGSALVVLAPGSKQATAVNAAMNARAPILWIHPAGGMMAVVTTDSETSRRLYAAGALFVTTSPALAGCAAALRA